MMDRNRWGDIGKVALGIYMVLVLVAAFFYAPPDVTLGQAARIIFFHIPVAWVTVLAFFISAGYSIRYLIKRQRLDDHRAFNAANIGIVFCVLATLTGSLFARITWGAFWNWDPRETSIFVLLLFYFAYFALRAAITDEETRATLTAAYSVLGIVVVPFLVFIVPRIAFGLHPDLFNQSGGFDMSPRMLQVFMASLAGFTGIFFWIYTIVNRVSRIQDRLIEQED
jgi:heme exporter protein C